jgi:hypothetical protein
LDAGKWGLKLIAQTDRNVRYPGIYANLNRGRVIMKSDIRTIETKEGLYVNLEDVIAVLKRIFKIFPSRVSVMILNLFRDGRLYHE